MATAQCALTGGVLVERFAGDMRGRSLRATWKLTRRLIVENGVTYNVYADPQGAHQALGSGPAAAGVDCR